MRLTRNNSCWLFRVAAAGPPRQRCGDPASACSACSRAAVAASAGWKALGRPPGRRHLRRRAEGRGGGDERQPPGRAVQQQRHGQAGGDGGLVGRGRGHALLDDVTAAARPGAALHRLEPPLSIGVLALGTPDGQAGPASARFAGAVAALLSLV
jgi:hypothetical protein